MFVQGNLTLAGIDWIHMRPDARVEIGEALLEITKATSPCTKIAASFRDGEFVRVSQKVHPSLCVSWCFLDR